MTDQDDQPPEAVGLFNYYNENVHVEVHPDPPTPMQARPFHVVGWERHHIPISVLVFARDKQHAIKRVTNAIEIVAMKEQKSALCGSRAEWLLEKIASGALKLHAEPIDIEKIVAKVNWSSNGGVV